MSQPRMIKIACRQCNSLYDSERELHEHMRAAHRSFVSEQSASEHRRIRSTSLELALDTPGEKWVELSVQLRNRLRDRFNPEELEAVDRFIFLASQAVVFAHLVSREVVKSIKSTGLDTSESE
jgi:hypothetical protein